MRAALICGSPKRGSSTSSKLLDVLQLRLENCADATGCDLETARFAFVEKSVSEDDLARLAGMDVWVFSLPLYVDGIPGHVLSCLEQICRRRDEFAGTRVFALENCGFYEGIQTELAFEVLKNWCTKCGFVWSGGIGVGGAPALGMFKAEDFGKGPTRQINDAMKVLARSAVEGTTIDNAYPGVAIPRFIYKFAAERGWRSTIKANGGKPQDLGKRL